MFKKSILSVLLIMGFAIASIAQIQAPAIVLAVNGKVRATTKDGKFIRVKEGTALMSGATIGVKKNASVLYLYNDKFTKINKKSTIKIEPDGTSNRKLNFDATFAEFLKASLSINNSNIHHKNFKVRKRKHLGDGWGVNDPNGTGGWGVDDPNATGGWGVNDPNGTGGWGVNDPNGTGGWGVTEPLNHGGWGVNDPNGTGGWGITAPNDIGGWGVNDPNGTGGWGVDDPNGTGGWGVDDPNGTGGWGKADMTIQVQTPGGLYSAAINKLQWIKIPNVPQYLVVIVDEELNLVYRAKTKNNKIIIDMTKFDIDKTYYWQIFAKDKRAISIPVTFNVVDNEEYSEIKNLAKNSNIYKRSSSTIKQIMEAVAFENEGMLLNAQKTYEAAFTLFPRSRFVKMNYVAFCMRMGQRSKAVELARKI